VHKPDDDAAKPQLLSPVADRCAGADEFVREPDDDAAKSLRCTSADEFVCEPDNDAAKPLL